VRRKDFFVFRKIFLAKIVKLQDTPSMTNYIPPHQPTDKAKLASLVEAIKSGAKITPVVVCGDIALTGSHRIAAFALAKVSPPVIGIEEITLKKALILCAAKDISETSHNLLCAALFAVCDGDAKDALADQCHDEAVSRREAARVALDDEEVEEEWGYL
jgi:hypothetical protein